jgi:hypothetical protein
MTAIGLSLIVAAFLLLYAGFTNKLPAIYKNLTGPG